MALSFPVLLAASSRWRAALTADLDQDQILARVRQESGWSPRYAFMILMSAGIAVLGLLLSSPAVVIGAMLISPLMNPILGLGFSLALFDFPEMRRSILALAAGVVSAVLFAALIVTLSPLKSATAEILSRTRPNLFDLLVALFAALAGGFALIRGRGETITGVAIATATMPPLAVVGYGLATSDWAVLAGSLGLFFTNIFTIALAATAMARIYGFGRHLTRGQTWVQTLLLALVFAAMAVPLGFELSRIARDALVVGEVRAYLGRRFGDQARLNQLQVDFDARPIAVRAVVIAPRSRAVTTASLAAGLRRTIGAPVDAEVDQVLLGGGVNTLEADRTSLRPAPAPAPRPVDPAQAEAPTVARIVAVASGAPEAAVTVDAGRRRALAAAASLPGADLAIYRALEDRARREAKSWDVRITPPLQPFPPIRFARGRADLDPEARAAAELSAWAARRWNDPALAVPGLPGSPPKRRATLDQRRALAVASILGADGVESVPAPGGGRVLRLAPARPATEAKSARARPAPGATASGSAEAPAPSAPSVTSMSPGRPSRGAAGPR